MTKIIQIKQRFKSSIRRGTGEAYLLMQAYPKIDFSNDIIKASIKNFAYDGQCEDSRDIYLYGLISLSSNRMKIRHAILNALATERKDTWSLTQLFELASIFANDGDHEAKKAIYDRFFTNPIEGADWVGYSEILQLDGFEGLKFIADKMGRALEANPDNWQDDSILKLFQEKNPEMRVITELEDAGKINRFIKIYLESVKRTGEQRKITRETINYKNIVDEILSNRIFYLNSKRRLTNDEIKLVAHKLLTEKNVGNKEKLLAVFGREKFPFDSQFILKLASDKRKSRSRELAIHSLSLLNSEIIRAFALEGISKSKSPGSLVAILKSNYNKGDNKILADLVKKFKSPHVIESLAISYINVYQANAMVECKEPLEAIYNKLTCAIHRRDIIKVLIENNAMSDKIKNEIKFDCDNDIRQLFKRSGRGCKINCVKS